MLFHQKAHLSIRGIDCLRPIMVVGYFIFAFLVCLLNHFPIHKLQHQSEVCILNGIVKLPTLNHLTENEVGSKLKNERCSILWIL